jgi:hypothetical protein
MLWGMKKRKVDPAAYAAKARKDAEKMQAMSEAFGSHTRLTFDGANATGTRKSKKT